MKAMVYKAPGILEIEEVPDVFPKDNEVKIRVKSCGVCGSDVHGFLGLTGRRIPPLIMGHEFAGEVAEAGKNVISLKSGDRVAVYPVDYCGRCDMCNAGMYHLCPNKRQFGVMTVDGAYAEYICVPENLCFKIGEGVPYDTAALVEPVSVALHAVNHAKDLSGKTVLIIGAGTIGLCVLACVNMKKPVKVIVSDVSEPRLSLAGKMGADITVNPTKSDLRQEIDAATDSKGVDTVFEAVGTAETVKQSVSMLKLRGTAVMIGYNKPLIEVNMHEVITHELKIKGSFLYTCDEFENALSLINEGKLKVDPVISLSAPLSRGPELFKTLAHDPGGLVKVILKP